MDAKTVDKFKDSRKITMSGQDREDTFRMDDRSRFSQ
jgi:hypothetical protein